MNLKQAVLISLGVDRLRQIASDLDLPAAEYWNKKRLVQALLKEPAATRELLLKYLSASDRKQVEALCSISGAASRPQGPGDSRGGSEALSSSCFVAIDFETADTSRTSACAVALVRVVAEAIVDKASFLIRPPRRNFLFSYLHGITWADVANAPTFAELWPQMADKLQGATFLAAHNAAFDRSVLQACCCMAGLEPPPIPFRCTVQAARQTWKIFPTKLPDVCAFLNLPLQHHDAASDAEACARIMIAARRAGFR